MVSSNSAQFGDPEDEARLGSTFDENAATDQFKRMLDDRSKLPAWQIRESIGRLLVDSRVCVVTGETGCGKSTQVPQFLLDEARRAGRLWRTRVLVAQPRRISATSLAARVAAERAQPLGGHVGYQIRFENRAPRECGSLLYCTYGILLRRLEADAELSGVSHVILDEVHERDVFCDLLLVILRHLLGRRTDLTLILMSATMDAAAFIAYFKAFNAKICHISHRLHNVQRYKLEEVLEMIGDVDDLGFGKFGRRGQMHDPELDDFCGSLHRRGFSERTVERVRALDEWRVDLQLVVAVARHICESSPSTHAILIFLPGYSEISNLLKLFRDSAYFASADRFEFVPLHSLLPSFDQNKVFVRPANGCRKIVLSTNMAETSVTIDDVVYVIDSGKNKLSGYDELSHISTLSTEWVSRASAEQRCGRAGRVRDGFCYQLQSTLRYERLHERTVPEIQRVSLESVCLQIKLMNLGRIGQFLGKALDAPSDTLVRSRLPADSSTCAVAVCRRSIASLVQMGALSCEAEEELTPLGRRLAAIPLNPLSAKMIILGALFSCVDPILSIAVCMDYKEPFNNVMGRERQVSEAKGAFGGGAVSDHLMWCEALRAFEAAEATGDARQTDAWARRHFVNVGAVRLLQRMKEQCARLLVQAGLLVDADPRAPHCNLYSSCPRVVQAVVCAGVYPRVAEFVPTAGPHSRRPPLFRTKLWRRVNVHPGSVNADCRHFPLRFVCYHKVVKSSKVYLHDCGCVGAETLALFAGRVDRALDDDGSALLRLDEWIKLYCHSDTADFYEAVRGQLVQLLTQPFDRLSACTTSLHAEFIRELCEFINES